MKTSADIRSAFLDFFAGKGHEVVESSPLVPGNDPTLLFTNAGMVQFKDVFLGKDKRNYVRAVSSQRCVRAGGKHNDLENVGYTARHHTFFEMLGNFSFGDYFKREAIEWAWKFLTEELKLPANRLWVTVYADDDEAAKIWLEEMGVDPARFSRIGDKPGGQRYESDNFWTMGDTGPCGPCSEIFYDHGAEIPGGPPGTPEADGDRYIEIWNLVFTQFDRSADGTLKPLPRPSVDTGMGLERLAAVIQGRHDNYGIDLFRTLIDAAAEVTGCDDRKNHSLRVIADHIRACSFLIADGVLPANDGRGYVLRRIIRRALRHGFMLGQSGPFFHKLVAPLDQVMGEAHPALREARALVERTLKIEEERFAETLSKGMKVFEEAVAGLQLDTVPGETAFLLYDTYGFPVDLTADVARERGLGVDMAGFEQAMAEQRNRARAASRFAADVNRGVVFPASEFLGYTEKRATARVIGIAREGAAVDSIGEGEPAVVFLDRTPFYAESGGQVGDTGRLQDENGAVFDVADTQKYGDAYGHVGEVTAGRLAVGDLVEAAIDGERRTRTILNHSATHLMHAALRRVLGTHVQQKGSLVAPDRLRFDFSHPAPLTRAELREIERLVNDHVRDNAETLAKVMPIDEAMAAGAMALFGEKYGDEVRVLRIGGDFSMELCGGTHVERAGDIGLFRIVSEGGVAAGVRRIEAVTGAAALDYDNASEDRLLEIAGLLKAGRDDVNGKVVALLDRSRALEKELDRLKTKLASGGGSDLASQAVDIDGIKVLAAQIDGADAKALREAVDRLKDKLGSAAIVLGATNDGKVSLVAGVTRDLTDRIRAGDLVNAVATRVGGRGGGRPDMAQAGGDDPAALPGALDGAIDWIRATLN